MSNQLIKKFCSFLLIFLEIMCLQNTDPILAAVNSYDKYLSIERNKIRHKIRHSVSEKPILTKLLKSLII